MGESTAPLSPVTVPIRGGELTRRDKPERDLGHWAIELRLYVLTIISYLALAAAICLVAGIRGARLALVILLSLSLALVTARIMILLTDRASRGVVKLLTGAGNLTPTPSFSLEESLIVRGKYQDAEDSFQRHLAENPNDHHAMLALASLSFERLGDKRQAERLWIAVRDNGPTVGLVMAASQRLIELYRGAGDRGKLMAELGRFVSRFPDSPAGISAKRSLLELKTLETAPVE